MTTFKGFPSGKAQTVAIHSQFISELVPRIDNLAELKLCLFCYYALLQKEGDYRYLRQADLLSSKELMLGLGDEETLDTALVQAVEHGFLLAADILLDKGQERLYFVNTAKGRSAIEQIQAGRWKFSAAEPVEILPERPTIFRLYEENIGALTPAIAERLKAAEQDFSYEWIVEAINLAIDNNKRKWAYINAILERWKQEGRNNVHETTERPHQSNGKFATSRWSDFSE
jgi:DNA replication protein